MIQWHYLWCCLALPLKGFPEVQQSSCERIIWLSVPPSKQRNVLCLPSRKSHRDTLSCSWVLQVLQNHVNNFKLWHLLRLPVHAGLFSSLSSTPCLCGYRCYNPRPDCYQIQVEKSVLNLQRPLPVNSMLTLMNLWIVIYADFCPTVAFLPWNKIACTQ